MASSFNRGLRFALLCFVHQACALSEGDVIALKQRLELPALSRGHFEQIRELKILPQGLKSSGEFFHAPSLGLYWHVTQPLNAEMKVHNGVVLERFGDAGEWSRPLLGESGSAIAAGVFMSLMAGDLEALQEYFDVQLLLDDLRWSVDLTPKVAGLNQMIRRMHIKGAKQIEELVLVSPHDEETKITLTYGLPLPPTDAELALFSAPAD